MIGELRMEIGQGWRISDWAIKDWNRARVGWGVLELNRPGILDLYIISSGATFLFKTLTALWALFLGLFLFSSPLCKICTVQKSLCRVAFLLVDSADLLRVWSFLLISSGLPFWETKQVFVLSLTFDTVLHFLLEKKRAIFCSFFLDFLFEKTTTKQLFVLSFD